MRPVSGPPERPRIASKLAPTGAGRRSRSLSERAAFVGATLIAIKDPSWLLARRPRIASKLAPTGAGRRSRSLSVRTAYVGATLVAIKDPSWLLARRPRIASKLAPTSAGRRSRSLSVRAAYVGATLVAIKDPSSLLARRPRIASKLAPTGVGRRNRSPRASHPCRSDLGRDQGPCVAADCQQSVRLQPSGQTRAVWIAQRFSARNTKLRPWASAAAFWLYMGRAQQLKPWSTPG